MLTRAELREDMTKMRDDLRGEMVILREDLRGEMFVIRNDLQTLRTEFEIFKKEVYSRFENLEYRMTIKFGFMQAASVAVLAAIIKLT